MTSPSNREELSKFEPDYTNPIFTEEQMDEMWEELQAFKNENRSSTWIIEGVFTYFAKQYAQQVAIEAELKALRFSKQSASDNITFSGWEDDINRRIAELEKERKQNVRNQQ